MAEGREERRIVHVDVSYDFQEQDQCYRAKIRAYLPSKDGLLCDEFRNEDMEFFSSVLNSCWGLHSEKRPGYRTDAVFVYASTVDEVKEKVKAKIEKEIGHLRQVVEKNVLARTKTPEPEHYEFVI